MRPGRPPKWNSQKKKLCSLCGEKVPRFRHRRKKPNGTTVNGQKYKSDADHNLCPRCYRSVRDQVRPKPPKRHAVSAIAA